MLCGLGSYVVLQHPGIIAVKERNAIMLWLLPPHQFTACLWLCVCVSEEGGEGTSAPICVFFCLTDCDTEQWLHSVLQSLSAGDNE